MERTTDRVETAPIYDLLEQRLARAGVDVGAAEAQGVLCGMLCAGTPDAMVAWFAELFEEIQSTDPLVLECQQELYRVLEQTRAEIDGPGLGFSLLLPGDEQPLAARAQALVEWCQGFLYGVGLSAVSETSLSPHTREALADLAEITRMDQEKMVETEAHEEAYMELAEFVWVAAMLLHEDRVGDGGERR